ncbi:cysteine hydrolase family protein [Kiloniella laminariae]|uniref:cysteine hydrolase family protein n=1 Tax=Kiloniella laminariae TaxID=454162 RepID=UPI0003A01F26|nr:cysteine hydrolase family protein [Kiloniella laminariae]
MHPENTTRTALILVDIQNDYFLGGNWPLQKQEQAAEKAQKLLEHCRSRSLPVIHIQHISDTADAPFFAPGTGGAAIHQAVTPKENETVVIKSEINGFKNTELLEILKKQGFTKLVIAGSMSHMCIDALTRAASDHGFDCVVAEDACATRDLEFKGVTIPAEQVHAAFMSALAFAYAKVTPSDDALNHLV